MVLISRRCYSDSPEKMSRLRWLNSTIGTDKNVIIKPFKDVNVSNTTIRILGRDIELNEFGLPEKISSYFTQEMTKFKEEKDRKYLLEQIVEAYKYVETGQKIGNVVITVGHDN